MSDPSIISMNDDARLSEVRVTGETLVQGCLLRVERDVVRLCDGSESVREYCVHPGAVMIIPLLNSGEIILERQFRYPVGQVMIEFPAGKLDPQEDPLICAKRELLEETGYTAKQWFFLTKIHPVIGYSNEIIYVYLARDLIKGEQCLDAGEFLEIFTATPEWLLDQIHCGMVSDAKTQIGGFWLEKYLNGSWLS
jgi:ADP-ribose pyrophosphatase